MVMMCFVLDLRTLSPPLIRDLKQSLLQLANLYAISSPIRERRHSKKPLPDRIGLCYIINERVSGSSELKVAYTPRGNFSLRDFHHAVTNLPIDTLSPTYNISEAVSYVDAKLPSVLSDKVLYSWIGHEKDITRKVILISSSVIQNLDSETRKTLMDAADKCVSVEFVFLEQRSSHIGHLPETINKFLKQICDLENCSFRTFLPDAKVLSALVKRWQQELQDDLEEQLLAHFIFKRDIIGSLKQISCGLYSCYNRMIDGFTPCQTCRCHDMPLDVEHGNKIMRSSCPLTGNDLEALDLFENSVRVGEQIIMLMPSFQCCLKLQEVSSPVKFHVIERTNLGSLSEGVIFGPSFLVIPSSCPVSEDIDNSELNAQVFQGLCNVLHSLDQGLVCSSNCNIETLKQTSFQCFYILFPSDKGLMLLRRLAGSEEVLPAPDVNQLIDSTASKEIENSVRASLLKMEVSDYNPVLHERGFHQKLNVLVKESLQFGSLPPKLKETTCKPISTRKDSSEKDILLNQPTIETVIMEEEQTRLDSKVKVDKTTDHNLMWERLMDDKTPKRNPSEGTTALKQATADVVEEVHTVDKTADSTTEWEQMMDEESPKENPSEETSLSKQATDIVIIEGPPQLDPKGGEDKMNACITKEWEQLIVDEIPKKISPTCVAKPKFDQPVLSLTESSKHLDEKTSRILERLEVPRQMRKNVASPTIVSVTTEACLLTKKPLIPFGPIHAADQGPASSQSSQPMKPNFQRLKRKLR